MHDVRKNDRLRIRMDVDYTRKRKYETLQHIAVCHLYIPRLVTAYCEQEYRRSTDTMTYCVAHSLLRFIRVHKVSILDCIRSHTLPVHLVIVYQVATIAVHSSRLSAHRHTHTVFVVPVNLQLHFHNMWSHLPMYWLVDR